MGVIVKGLVGFSLVIIFSVVGILFHILYPKVPDVPKLEDTWWGPRDPSEEDTSIKPFKINVPDEVLNDLRWRLEHVLPFQEPLEPTQHYGMNTRLLKNITDFWLTKYNWREREKFLNQFPQYTVSIQGLKIHYIHVKPQNTKGLKVLPILIMHGWPGSVREFYEMIPFLTTPQKGRDFVFEVIAPSLPGFGFSEAAVKPGLGIAQMAVVFKNLMEKLNFDKYYLQGGDWGSQILKAMTVLFPEKIIGGHSNMCTALSPVSSLTKLYLGSFWPSLILEKDEDERLVFPLSQKFTGLILESGYFHIQATKPDTIGVGLRESPVGLAAYILEKFSTGTNAQWKNLEDGGLTKKFSMTNLLDNVMIYWVTGTMTSAMRIYAETANKAHMSLQIDKIPVKVPSACARFIRELSFPPRSILKDIYHNLVHVSTHDGGHFAAFEAPEVLANDIYEFVGKVGSLEKRSSERTKQDL